MVLIFAFILSLSALAKDGGHMPFLYGEKDFGHYYGPAAPEFRKGERLGRRIFENEQRESNIFFYSTQTDLLDLSEYFLDLETANFCPNSDLAKHFEYIRYLYRLLALSHLDEHLKDMGEISKKMKLGSACGHDVGELLSKCQPRGKDMKLFVKSANVLSRNFEDFVAPYDFPYESFSATWIKELQNGSRTGPGKRRLGLQCKDGVCGKMNKKKLAAAFEKACEADKKEFIRICSEKDHIFGISNASEAFHAISASDALKVINDNGHGRGCLARFARIMSSREVRSEALEAVVSSVYENLRKADDVEVSGRLFPAGSLKRFIEGGVGSIFVEKKVSETKNKEKKEAAPVALAPLAPEPIKKILAPPPKKKAVAAKPVKKEKPKPRKSHFLQTAEARKEFDLDTVKVDMFKFKYDYVFTSKMLSFLDEQMEKFTTRKGLEEMRDYDSLGTKKGAVPLLFIKYLVDNDRHQGLSNIVEVLGDEFYVKNNIDAPELATPFNYVKLKFEENSDHFWQLYILKDPNTNERE